MIPTKDEWMDALNQRHGVQLQSRFSSATVLPAISISTPFTFTMIAPPKIKIRETSDLEVSRCAHKSPYVGIIQIRYMGRRSYLPLSLSYKLPVYSIVK